MLRTWHSAHAMRSDLFPRNWRALGWCKVWLTHIDVENWHSIQTLPVQYQPKNINVRFPKKYLKNIGVKVSSSNSRKYQEAANMLVGVTHIWLHCFQYVTSLQFTQVSVKSCQHATRHPKYVTGYTSVAACSSHVSQDLWTVYHLIISHNYGKSPFSMAKSTIFIASFNSKL